MLDEKELFLDYDEDNKLVKSLLNELNLEVPKNTDYTIGIYEQDKLIGVGSLKKNIIVGVGIDRKYHNKGISAKIITNLINKAVSNKIENLLVFTSQDFKDNFINLGFKLIVEVEPYVALLEWGNGLEGYLKELEEIKKDYKNISSIVMNANPFTLGHRYLIEKALDNSDYLYIFVLKAEESMFTYEERFNLIAKGIKGLNNIKLVSGGDYIISLATFPSYFTKDENLAEIHAKLDISIFLKYIIPSLNIKSRYVGSEPNSIVTNIYNRVMKEILSEKGINVVEIKRLENKNIPVSASGVRNLLEDKNYKDIEKIVPKSTFDYIKSLRNDRIVRKGERDEDR